MFMLVILIFFSFFFNSGSFLLSSLNEFKYSSVWGKNFLSTDRVLKLGRKLSE